MLPEDKAVKAKGSDTAQTEAKAKDEADRGEADWEDICQSEGKEAPDSNVANKGFESDELGLAEGIEDASEEVAKHEGNIEGEEDEGEADIVTGGLDTKNKVIDREPGRDGEKPGDGDCEGDKEVGGEDGEVALGGRDGGHPDPEHLGEGKEGEEEPGPDEGGGGPVEVGFLQQVHGAEDDEAQNAIIFYTCVCQSEVS